MEQFKEKFINNYLKSRDWILMREGKMFNYFSPPISMKLPKDYLLEIPKINNNHRGYDNYINRLILELSETLPTEFNSDDLKILFSKENSIVKYRVFDSDNNDGTISFQKYIESLDGFKKVLSQAVTFTSTKKTIFGEAKFEVDSYLNRCRSLQTEKGSYVTKIEIPNDTIYSTVSKLETSKINNNLFDVIEFLDDEIFKSKRIPDVNEAYIEDIKQFLNYELFFSIKNLYYKTNINNIEYQLSSNNSFRKIETKRVQKRIPYFNTYLKNIKLLLLEIVPLEAIGYIKRLASPSPLHSKRNEIIIDAQISNSIETIKIILKSDEYIEAIEAHKNEWPIKIKGLAKQGKTMLTINELEVFEIMKQ